MGGVQRCPGYDSVPLDVAEGDLRYDVDAGVRTDALPDQNTTARRLADRDAAGFDCTARLCPP